VARQMVSVELCQIMREMRKDGLTYDLIADTVQSIAGIQLYYITISKHVRGNCYLHASKNPRKSNGTSRVQR